jgi:predicted dehydrogenase
MDKVRIGIVGCGIGSAHVRSIAKCADAEVAALCDIDKARADKLASEHDIPSVFTDYQDMLAQDGIDAVIVATPNKFHAPIAIAAFEAGKHVMCEKPLAINAVEGKAMVEAGKKSGKLFMMGFNNRFRGDSQLLKKYIENGELGEIYYAKTGWVRRKCLNWISGWFAQKDLAGGGPLIDIGVHVLDLALWLMGNPKPVSVMGSAYSKLGPKIFAERGMNYEVEDLAAAFVKLDNGATVVMEASWQSHVAKEQIYTQLVGTEGGAEFDPLRIYKDQHGTAVDIQPQFEQLAGHEMEIKHFVACIKGECECISTGEHGLHVTQILDAIYESTRTGRSVDVA